MLVASGRCASQEPNQQVRVAGRASSSRPAGPDCTSRVTVAAPLTLISSATTVSATVVPPAW